MLRYIFPFLLFVSFYTFASDELVSGKMDKIESRCKLFSSESRCIVNKETGGVLGFSVTPIYKNYYEITVIPSKKTTTPTNDASCAEGKTNVVKKLPANSNFRQTLHYDSQTKDEMIVHVTKVPISNGVDQNTADGLRQEWFAQPWIVCNAGSYKADPNAYKRVGGIDTGVLVIPFKLRQGDIFSDSTVGPYFSYKFERLELIATAGLAQISVAEISSDEIESKSGVTAGFGISFELAHSRRGQVFH